MNPPLCASGKRDARLGLLHDLMFLACLVVLVLFPYLRVGLTTLDDMWTKLMVPSMSYLDGTGFSYGRWFNYASAVFFNGLLYKLDSLWYQKLLTYGPILLDVSLFAWLISLLTGSKGTAVLFAALFLGLYQDDWDHNLLTSFPLGFQTGLCLVLSSALLFHYYLRRGRAWRNYASAFLFLLALPIYELFCLYLALLPLVYVLAEPDDARGRSLRARIGLGLRSCLPHLVAAVAYVAAYLVLRAKHPSTGYGGADIAFNLQAALHVLRQLSLWMVPGSHVFSRLLPDLEGKYNVFYYDIHDLPFFSFPLLHLQDFDAGMVARVLVLAILVCRSVLRGDLAIGLKGYATALAASLLLIVLPNVPVAMTPKYQEWVRNGVLGYATSYFSYFGIVLFFSCTIMLISSRLPRLWARIALCLALMTVLVPVGFWTAAYSGMIVKNKIMANEKWVFMKQFMHSELFKALPDNAVLYAYTLFIPQLGPSLGVPDDYWDIVARQETGKRVRFARTPEIFKRIVAAEPGVKKYYFRHSQDINAPEQHIVFGEASEVAYMDSIPDEHSILLYGDTFYVFHKARGLYFSLAFEAEPHAPVPFGSQGALKVQGNLYSLRYALPEKKYAGPMPGLTIGVPHTLLNSVVVTASPDMTNLCLPYQATN